MRIPYFGRASASAGPAAPPPPRRRRKKGLSWPMMLTLLLVALLVGMVGGLGSPPLLLVVGAIVFAMLLFFLASRNGLMVILFISTFAVQGSALYFLGMKSAQWVTVGFAMMFVLRTVLELLLSRHGRGAPVPAPEGGAMITAAGLYLLSFAISMVINRVPAMQIVSASKATMPMLGVLLSLYCVRWDGRALEKLWTLMLLIAMAQMPVVLYQHFFIAGARTYDSIVGTFGGTPGFGGNSAGLVIFVLATMTYALARWNRGLLSPARTLGVVGVSVAIVLLGEVKAAFIWLPFATFWVLRERIMKNVLTMIAYGMVIVVFMGCTYAVYSALYWGKDASKGRTVAEKLDARGGYFFDPNSINYQTGEVSRAASLAIWANDRGSSLPKRLIGFGPGACKSGGALGPGQVARRFAPLIVDATALVIVLWDEGILGALAYVSLMLLAIRTGLRVARQGALPPAQLAIVEACVPVLMICLSTLVYNRGVVEEPTAELLLMFCMGCVVQIGRYGLVAARSAPATAPAPYRAPASAAALHG